MGYDNLRNKWKFSIFQRFSKTTRLWGWALKLDRSNWIHFLIYHLGNAAFRILYRLQIEGRRNIPSQGPCVILPKHQFWTDIPIVGIAAVRPLYYIAKQELFEFPGISHFIRLLGGIPLDRQNPLKSLQTFRFIDELLQRKEYIVLFPEGTYYPYCLGPGKHRLIQRFLRLQEERDGLSQDPIPFIPVGIHYEKKKIRPRIWVRIGAPLYSKGQAEAFAFTRRIMEEIGKLSHLLEPSASEAAQGELPAEEQSGGIGNR